MEAFEVLQMLGRGSFGVAHKVRRVLDGLHCVVKRVNTANSDAQTKKLAAHEVCTADRTALTSRLGDATVVGRTSARARRVNFFGLSGRRIERARAARRSKSFGFSVTSTSSGITTRSTKMATCTFAWSSLTAAACMLSLALAV
jgi:hypothetical protein